MSENEQQDAPDTPEFDRWLADFFASYYRHRPVNATFIGVHDYDACLPDLSASGIDETLSGMQSLLSRAAELPAEPLSAAQRIDKRLCEGFLQIQCSEYEQDYFVRGNPALYTGEAIFGVLAMFLADFAPLSGRVAAAAERLNAIPELLRQARENVRQAPAEWIKLAMAECGGALAFLDHGALLAAGNHVTGDYRNGAGRAKKAFAEYRTDLKEMLERSVIDRYGCGEAALSLYLREAHCLNSDSDEIVRYAEQQLCEASRYLDEHCADFAAATRAEVLSGLQNSHPAIDRYYGRYQEIWDDIRRIAEEKELLTWPEFPVRYIPQPDWARAAAPYLYFLFYRSPAAFGGPRTHHYLVTPIDRDMPQEQQRSLLRANNDSAIRLNHVVHHGGIGHHVQNWHAFRAASRVGQIAAVDCASRTAMHCGGTMAEGWACYATDLISEMGGLSDREKFAEYQARTRMSARAIVDIRLHQGRLSFDEAVAIYVKNAGMSPNSAIYETTRNSMYPGSAVIYLTGCDAIHDLRRQMRALQRDRFSLCRFHDKFLSYGSIPVTLIAEAMLDEEKRAGQQPVPGSNRPAP